MACWDTFLLLKIQYYDLATPISTDVSRIWKICGSETQRQVIYSMMNLQERY